jgi:PAS domain S-box-containing protein
MSLNRQHLLAKLTHARQHLKNAQMQVAKLEALLGDGHAATNSVEPRQNYNHVLDTLIEGCQIIGFDWRYLYVNDVTAQQGHQPKEALLGHRMMDVYPGIDETPMFAVLQRCMEHRIVQSLENEFLYPDGSKAWFELSIQPIPEGIFILSLDITERKRSEIVLRRYAQRMEILHEIDISIIEARSIERLVGAALKQFRQVVPCQRAGILIFDQEHHEALIFAVDLQGHSEIRSGTRAPLPSESWIADFPSNGVKIVDDLLALPDPIPSYRQAIKEGMRSALHVLLMSEGQPIGLFNLLMDTPDFFTSEHVEIAVEVAHQLIIAMQQKRLAEQMAQQVIHLKAAEAALQKSHDTLEERVIQRTTELKSAKERVEAILNNSLDGILLLDSNLQVQQTNAAFDRLFACDIDDYFGRSVFSLVHPDDVESLTAAIQDGRVEQIGKTIEVRAQRKDGILLDAELSISFIKNNGCVCTIHDITEQKAKERQLRLYASLQQNVSDAVISTDMTFHIQSWNTAAERIYGWREEEVKGKPVDDILQTHYAFHGQQAAAIQQLHDQGWWHGEVLQHHKDGSDVYILGSVTLIKDEHGLPLGVVSVNRDNTQRKKADQILQAKLDEEREFQSYLKRLHHITIELTQIEYSDHFYKRAVELGLEQFGFERLGLLLYDANQHLAIGTYGTDGQGKLSPEHHLKFDPRTPTGILSRTLTHEERFSFDAHAPLYSDMKLIGWGWNAAAALWKGTENLGWLTVDNGVHHTPASRPLLDILSLYALTLSTLLVQKRGEFALRKSEARYRLLAENITDVIARFNPEGTYLYVSPSSKAVLGYEPEEAVGKSFFDFIHPDDVKRVVQLRREQTSESPEIPLTYRFRHSEGHYIWIEVMRQPIRSEDTGEIREYIASARDVTTRKQAEDALKQNEQLLRIILDTLPVGVWTIDMEGNILFGNPAGQKIWAGTKFVGLEQYGTYKAWWLDTGKPVQPEEWAAARAITKGETSLNEELEIEAFDGTRKYILNSALPIRNDQGDILGAITVSQDITERQQLAAELEQQRTFLRQVIDVSPSMIFVKDYNGHFVLVNPMVAKMYSTTVEALIGKTDADFNASVTEIDTFREADRRVILSGEPFFNEEPITNSAGETHWLQTTKVPIISADGKSKHVLGVSTDITARRRSEETLRQALEKEKELGDLKTRFVSMASHEFRTPLATIYAITETLMAYRHRLPDEQIEERLSRIQDQVGYLKAIMDDVLLLARMQARRVEFNPTKLNLDAVCHSVIDEFQSHSDESPRLLYSCDEELHEVTVDRKLMRQIISNLVSNAVKYSPRDETITVRLEHKHDSLILLVSDKGIGIPEADLKHLFQPFHRAANVGTISGTGLGMVIAKEAVDLHGGTIAVESTVGVGTTFTVSIPLDREGENDHDQNSNH